MRKSFLLYLLISLLASCNNDIEIDRKAFTFCLTTEDAPDSKGADQITRYILEMYESNLSATPIRITNSDGRFNVTLSRERSYICFFWADNSTDYDVSNLKSIHQIDPTKLGTAAYTKKVIIDPKSFNGNIVLKRAISELVFIDSKGLAEVTNKFRITYPFATTSLNIIDDITTNTKGTLVRTIVNIGKSMANTPFTSDIMLSSTTSQVMTGLKLLLNSETEKTLDITINANRKSNITGEYWTTKPKQLYKVGDYYPDPLVKFNPDKTISIGTAPIGIVFWIDTTDTSYNATLSASGKGKIVSLNEGSGDWGPVTINEFKSGVVGINSTENGSVGTRNLITKHKDDPKFNPPGESKTGYIIFRWVYITKNKSDINGRWYIPAINELTTLCTVWNGGNTTIVNLDARILFNLKLTVAGGEDIATNKTGYYSSTENNVNDVSYINFHGLTITTGVKNVNARRVRAISAF